MGLRTDDVTSAGDKAFELKMLSSAVMQIDFVALKRSWKNVQGPTHPIFYRKGYIIP